MFQRMTNTTSTGQRRQSRRTMNIMTLTGILNVNKPPGPTSREVVDRVERLCRPAKAGHAGTLDPLATGVLVICVGQATRLIQYVQRMRKHYRATFLLGHASETDDTEGEVTESDDAPQPTRAKLIDALPQFPGRDPAAAARSLGHQSRRPPCLQTGPARRRRSNWHRDRRNPQSRMSCATTILLWKLDIECGSGTYVRALGRDLAAELGTTAVMSALERTAIGGFRVEDAVTLDDLATETIAQALAAAADCCCRRAKWRWMIATHRTPPRPADRHPHVRRQRPRRPATSPEWAALTPAGQLAAIFREKRPGQLWPTETSCQLRRERKRIPHSSTVCD